MRTAHAVVVATALLGTMIVVWPGVALAAPSWLAPTDLAPGVTGVNVDVAVDVEGNATAVWRRSDAGVTRIESATRPRGGGWSPVVTVSTFSTQAPGTAGGPRVVVDDAGVATAVWERYAGDPLAVPAPTVTAVVQSATRPPGGAWQPPQDLSAPSPNVDGAQVVIDAAGQLTAAWRNAVPGGASIQAATRDPGAGWQPPQTVSEANENALHPHLAVGPAGDALLSWLRASGVPATFQVRAASRPVGGSWQTPASLSDAGAQVSPAHGAVGPSSTSVIWREGVDVREATRLGGGAWADSVALPWSGGPGDAPLIAIADDDRATAVWASSGPNSAIFTTTRPLGGDWTAPEAISASDRRVSSGRLAVGPGGRLTAAWVSQRSDGYTIEAATRAFLGPWSGPLDLGPVPPGGTDDDPPDPEPAPPVPAPPVPPTTPRVLISDQGDSIVSWQHPTRGPLVAVYDAAGPALNALTVPETMIVGVTRTFSVAPRDAWSATGPTTWDLGDGTIVTGTTVTHAYTTPGPKTVTVTATDALESTTTTSRTVTVLPASPPPNNDPAPAAGGSQPSAPTQTPGPSPAPLLITPPLPPAPVGAAAPAAVSEAQIRVALSRALVPRGRAAAIAGLLRRGYPLTFNAPVAGRLRITWSDTPARKRRIVLAVGTATVTATSNSRVVIRLTKAGKQRLKRSKRLRVTGQATLTPTGKRAVTATTTFTVKR